jgi:YfiR/HmsC-like
MSVSLRRLIVAALAVLSVLAPAVARIVSPENAVKAAFVYNFAKFVDWPAAAFADRDAVLNLCILGRDGLADALKGLDGKTVGDRRIAILRLESGDAVNCHMVYVGRSEVAALDAVVKRISRRHVLTIANTPSFATRGGIINLYTAGDRVHFEINVAAARRAGLRLSARLLELAKIVVDPRDTQ